MKKTKAKNKKILGMFMVLIITISASVMLYASSIIDDPINISFQDKNLFNAIKLHFEVEGLKFNLNESTLTLTVSEEELNQIEELNLKGVESAQITNATGIESFINLKKINLADNNITDITPISKLENLISLDLSNNSKVNIYNKNDGSCYLPNQANIEELYISGTKNSDISFASKLTNIKVLDLSNNGISVLTPLKTLRNIETLDISNNTSITTIDDILSLTTLKKLDISTTGITSLLHSDYRDGEYEYGIFVLTNLESLNVENNKLSIDPIYRRYTTQDWEERIYLTNLKILNFNYTGQSGIDYWGLSQLKNLTHLYMKGNDISYISSEIATLPNLEYINLAENQISDISGFIRYGYDENGNQIIEDVLQAKQIILEHNRIQDITPLALFNHDITYLDLSSNAVFYVDAIDFGRFSFSQGLDLTRQGRDHYGYYGEEELIWFMQVKNKKAKTNQYIILPTLFQNSKNNSSVIHAENIEFSFENISLNPDSKYHVPGYYNVVIEPKKDDEAEERILSITLHGGCADDSILHFRFADDTSSIDSLIFPDENLAKAIDDELRPRINEYTYVKRALDILNITNSLVNDTNLLHLEDKKISDLTGLSSFENLTHVYLSNNNISSIDELKFSENMTELYVSNNPKIGNNYSAIERMTNLTKLDLSTIGMTSINSLQNLITKWEENNYYPLTYLNISNNEIGNIENIGKISSLEELYISNVGIESIQNLNTLTNLKTLNVSGNEIKEIDSLQSLTKLKYLTLSNNKIEDIQPISKISLDSLDFSNNKVKDVSSLTKLYTTIKMDTNRISDISNFDGKLIENFSVTNQKITNVIESEENEDIIIQLPEIFKDSKESTSKVYTEKNFVTTNCELASDGKSVVVNPQVLGSKIATVKIVGGNANYTTFSIAAPLKGTITYLPENTTPTNQDVTAKISFDRNATITNNEGSNTYTFTENGEFTFEYEDEYGFSGSETALVNNIDKIAPQGTVIQEVVDESIVVTISVDEPIKQPEGWRMDENNNITKTYTQDAEETVILEDEAGNTAEINVKVKFDKDAPIITGVETGETYNKEVTPVVEDENEVTVTLTKDGEIVSDYKLGDSISEAGKYELTATDTLGNTTTVEFEIKIEIEIEIPDEITSEEVTVIEETQRITDVKAETTVSELKDMLISEMEYEIVDQDGNELSETENVATGYKVKMTNDKTYTIIVIGDCDGDGTASIQDIFKINKHRIYANKNVLKDEYLIAADVDADGDADIFDIFTINKMRLK